MNARLFAFILAGVALCCTPILAYEYTWRPVGHGTISVTTTSAPVGGLVLGNASVADVCNDGSTDAYVVLGTGAQTATTAGSRVKAGKCNAYDLGPPDSRADHIAAITAASTTTLYVETGDGLAPGI